MNSTKSCELFAALVESRLLTAEQFSVARSLAARGQGSEALARELVRRRWLTPWQLRHLTQGHTRFRCADYILLDILGRGSMGIVYKARKAGSPRLFAVKVISANHAGNRRLSARFQREIRLVSSVRSPNVVRALDSGCIAGRDFLVTEYVAGRTLDYWIAAGRPLPVTWICECARQAAVGLQHVHESGLIHRDIKPSNIIVSAASIQGVPHARILDLGLGRFVGPGRTGDDLTRAGHTVGTLDYIAPEQLQDGRAADIRSDIYALGCTLFEGLTSRKPFEGADLGERTLAKLTGKAGCIADLRRDVPGRLADIVAQMMSREPRHRPAIPREVACALLPFSLGQRTGGEAPGKIANNRPGNRAAASSAAVSTCVSARPNAGRRRPRSRIASLLARLRFIHRRPLEPSK